MKTIHQKMADTAANLIEKLKAGEEIHPKDRKFLNSWLASQNTKGKKP